MKEELNTSIDVSVPNLEDETVRKAFLRKIYSNGIRKKQSVRMKERRMKQNRMLRKSLLPKNALMSLNEMKGIQISDFNIVQSPSGGGFVCSVNINNIQYEATGQSKAGAKNFCCEKAIRDIMLQKMMSLRFLKQQQQLKDGVSESGNESSTVEMKNENEESMDTEDNFDEDVPMLNLASYAIHKLFCQWETEGFDVPDIVNVLGTPPGASTDAQNESAEAASAVKTKVSGPSRSELPENHETMHPATLLCMMRPGITFEVIETIGQTPNIVQRVQVIVDENTFVGVGRSKKSARKDAAINACNEIFGTSFVNEIQA
ncbi:hypothetical protein ACFFRR_002957 [Megaselia abdita]